MKTPTTTNTSTCEECATAYSDGYADGQEDAFAFAVPGIDLPALFDRLGFDRLEPTTVRWDAARKRWIWTQAGEERTTDGEGAR